MNKKISTSFKIFSSILWVPVTLCISLEIITFSDWVYEYNWTRNQITQTTDIKIDQLNEVSDQIKSYFKDDQEKLEILLQQPGRQVFSLFNQKEIDHMVDVKNLIKATLLFERIGLVLLLIFFIFFLFKEGYQKFYDNFIRVILGSFLIFGNDALINPSVAINWGELMSHFEEYKWENCESAKDEHLNKIEKKLKHA